MSEKELKEYVEEESIGMSDEELEDMANFAGHLYDSLKMDRLKDHPRDLFILGFINGREFTLEQLGVYEEDDDDVNDQEMPEIIKKYLEYEAKKG